MATGHMPATAPHVLHCAGPKAEPSQEFKAQWLGLVGHHHHHHHRFVIVRDPELDLFGATVAILALTNQRMRTSKNRKLILQLM